MKVLFIGDSITNGKLGASYVQVIQQRHPDWSIQNEGRDGETFNLIMKRLVKQLRTDNSFDCVVLQGGYNDLLLPTFPDKGALFRFAYQQQRKKGLEPLSSNGSEAYDTLSLYIKEVKQLFTGRIVLTTIGCVGENLQSGLNRKRQQLNDILRRIAAEEELAITNTAERFDAFLQGKEQSDYCLDSFWAVTVLDRLTPYFSSRRKLHLTIDGVHLNSKGAELFADSVLAEF